MFGTAMVTLFGFETTADNALGIVFFAWVVALIMLGVYGSRKQWAVQQSFKIIVLITFSFLIILILTIQIPWYFWALMIFLSSAGFYLSYRFSLWRMQRLESIFGKEYWKKDGNRRFSFDLIPGTNEHKIFEANKTIQANPNDANAWHQKAIAFKNIGKVEQAEACLARAKELSSGMIEE